MKKSLLFLLLCFCIQLQSEAQVNYTANDFINPYTGQFRPGTNLGYYPPWDDEQLADIAAGNPALGIPGVGVKTIRTGMFDSFTSIWGVDFEASSYDYFQSLGLEDNTMIIGFPADWHRDQTFYCATEQSETFANMYSDIFDGGLNGTPVNENNPLAVYVYEIVNEYKDHVKFWEIWNEPGFDYTYNTGFQPPGVPGNWWENNPDPCDYKLRAPIFHYVRILRICYEVIKTVDPTAYASVAGFGYPAFLDAVLRNTDNPIDGSPTAEYPLGGGAYFDVFGNHAYPHFDGSTTNFGANFFERHSDAAADGLVNRRQTFINVLENYGYDGNTYPSKLGIITECNVPRRVYSGEYIGGEVAQYNYIIKAFIKAKLNDLHELHIYSLSEQTTLAEADFEFDLMGLYKKIEGTQPYTQVVNNEGIAYKTTSDFLFNTNYDAARTAQMNVPAGVRGHAFLAPNGTYVYALWAETMTDLSEFASATYSFPSALGISQLEKRDWDYSQTNQISSVSPFNIQLDGTPIFLFESNASGAPIANFSSNVTSGCPPLSVNFIDQSTGSPTSWNWTFEGGTPSTSTQQNPSVTFNNVGSYNVSLTVTNANGSDESTLTNYINVSGNAPNPAFTSLTNGLTATFTNNSTNAVNYSWDFGDGSTSTTVSPTHTYASNGTYTVTLTASSGCGSQSTTNTVTVDNNTSSTTDLELSISVDNTDPAIYGYVTFTYSVTNTSNTTAANILVATPYPDDLVYADNSVVTEGFYDVYQRRWSIETMAPNETKTLDLTLFTLVEDVPRTAYTQITAMSPDDIDSTPNNGTPPTPIEDDEAAVSIWGGGPVNTPPSVSLSTGSNSVTGAFTVSVSFSENVTGLSLADFSVSNGTAANLSGSGASYSFTVTPQNEGNVSINLPANTVVDNENAGNTSSNTLNINYSTGGGGDDLDLELSLTANNLNPSIYTNVTYTATLTNNSNVNATGVVVDFPFPDGLVWVDGTTTVGTFNVFIQVWEVGNLGAGQTATFELTLFTLVENDPRTAFIQVSAASPTDVDSTPNNGTAPTPAEDDEAAVTLWDSGGCNCPTTFDPVCGSNGVTYTNACEAECAGIFSYTPGECDAGCNCSTVYQPVCGSNGVTYFNACEAECDGIFTYTTGECVVGGDGVDIEVGLTASTSTYQIYTNITYLVTAQNTGTDAASNVIVDFQVPDGLVYVSQNVSQGDYSTWNGTWNVGNLSSGQIETLELTLFALVGDVTFNNYAQLTDVSPNDIDSSPNNGTPPSVNEDDEAVVTVLPSNNLNRELDIHIGLGGNKFITINNLYPTPSDNWVSLEMNAKKETNARVAIYDLLGQKMIQQTINLNEGRNTITFDIKELPSGVYQILFETPNGHSPIRFIKQRL